jgi:hypothetical protein
MNEIQDKLNKVKALYPNYEVFMDLLGKYTDAVGCGCSYTFGVANLTHSQLVPIVGFGERLLDSGFAPDLEDIAKKHQDLSLNNHLKNFLSWTETFEFKTYYKIRVTSKSGAWEKPSYTPEQRIKLANDIFEGHELSATHELKVFYSGFSFIEFCFIEKK